MLRWSRANNKFHNLIIVQGVIESAIEMVLQFYFANEDEWRTSPYKS